MGWRNLSFRGFADYMQTAEFKKGQSELLDLATEKKWRSCALKLGLGAVIARSFSDSLLIRGIEVLHIYRQQVFGSMG